MPRHAVPLTDVRIRNAKPNDFPLWDGNGLHLILRKGRMHWRLKYRRPAGTRKENRIALGAYPTVSLANARHECQKLRLLLAAGTDPSENRKAQRAEAERAARDTFARFAQEWLSTKARSGAASTQAKRELCVNRYLAPALGTHRVAEITSKDVVQILQRLNEHAPALTRKAAQAAQAIIRVAISAGARDEGRLLDLNLRDNLPAAEKQHYPAATSRAELRRVIRTVDAYPSPVTRAALWVCMYTALRPGVVAAMEWSEIDGAKWRIPAEKMKMRRELVVPIPQQMANVLLSMRPYTAGRQYVFPALARQKTPHLHRDALSKALRDAGLRGKQTPHGLRASFRTIAREQLDIAPDVLEVQLAHVKKGEVDSAYNRALFVGKRRHVMQRWANYLDALRDEPNRAKRTSKRPSQPAATRSGG